MTQSKHDTQPLDFKGALASIKKFTVTERHYRTGKVSHHNISMDDLSFKAIQTALRLADRLQSSEISGRMYEIGAINIGMAAAQHETSTMQDAGLIFKAMVQQLIKECE